MKIVSFNLRFGGRGKKPNPWRLLIDELQPDVVLAQESFHPKEYFSPEEFAGFKGCVWDPVEGRKWGSAILAPHLQLEAISLPSYQGWVVGARAPNATIGGTEAPLVVFSVHAPSPGPYEPIVNSLLDTLTAVGGELPLLLGGDFNITTGVRHETEALKNTIGERQIQARLRTQFRLFNAWQILHPNTSLPQTLRWSKDRTQNYHCDAVFVSDQHLRHLLSAEVKAFGPWETLSDHLPMVVHMA